MAARSDRIRLAALVLLLVLATSCSSGSRSSVSVMAPTPVAQVGQGSTPPNSAGPVGGPGNQATGDLLDQARQKIKHVIVIMQENRSFDSYFGTYPGVDGIPMQNGVPTACVPDPRARDCIKPFHDASDKNFGGPHGAPDAKADVDGGEMDGFVRREIAGRTASCAATPDDPTCSSNQTEPDVMGYHDAREIPNYWTYAEQFVLQDRMFEPNASWSLPAHLFMVSEWSALCSRKGDPSSCVSALDNPTRPPDFRLGNPLSANGTVPTPDYAWTDLTYLLHQKKISWAYYVADGTEPDCEHDEMICTPKKQSAGTPGIWNPLPWFDTVHQDEELGNIEELDKFYGAAKSGTLPAVSWIDPAQKVSEHPPALISDGQAYVTGLINAAMQGPDWNSTVIFLAWDDWGGFYDHVVPPTVDQNGYGLRVPSLVISPYSKKGYVDHQTLSFDAYVKFIEDLYLGGQRLDPRTDGRPDPRPNVRETASQLGNLLSDFDFTQQPRAALVLPERPPPGPPSKP